MAITHQFKRGFTLIEMILGIVVMGIAISGVLSIMLSFVKTSTEPIFETKASILAEHVMNRIYRVSFDHNSDHYGGECRCDEINQTSSFMCANQACTDSIGVDIQLELNAQDPLPFNDVDDFDTQSFCENSTYGLSKCKTSQTFCPSGKCLIPADFFTTNTFQEWVKSKHVLYDAIYKNFYVYIKVSRTNTVQDGLKGIVVAPNKNKLNADVYAQMKEIELSIISPDGKTYSYRFLRGNY